MEVRGGRKDYRGVCIRRDIFSALTVKYYTVLFVHRQMVSMLASSTAETGTNISE